MKKIITRFIPSHFLSLYVLHFLNDGFEASLLLLLPFIAKDFHISLSQVGVLGMLIASFDIVFALPAGYLATRIGGMKTLLFGLIMYAISFIGTSFAPMFLLLFPFFIFAGIGFGIYHPIGMALVAKLAKKEERGKLLGNFMAFGDFGKMSISAALAFFAASIGWQHTTLLYGLIAIGIGIFFYFKIIQSREHFQAKETRPPQISIKEIIGNMKFLFAVVTNFMDSFASSAFFLFLPFLLLKKGVDPAFLGVFSAAFFIGSLTGRLTLGRFVDKYNPTAVFVIGELLMGIFILFLSLASSIVLALLLSLILGIFTRGTVAATQTMIAESGEHHGNFEKLFAAKTLFVSIATTSAPLIYGLISNSFGITTIFFIMGVVAILATIPATGFYFVKQKNSSK